MGQRAGGMLNRFNPFAAQHVEPAPSADPRVAEGGGAPADGPKRPREKPSIESDGRREPRRRQLGISAQRSLLFGTLPDGRQALRNAEAGHLPFRQQRGPRPARRPRSRCFPYGGVSETVNMLNALVNIRRDSVKIIREESTTAERSYRLEFLFDCDVKCYVQVHFCAREVVEGENIKFDVRFPELKPTKKYFCDVGANQVFNEVIFKPHQFDPQKMYYNGGFWFPLVIEMRTCDQTSGFREQAQITMCVLERTQSQTCPLVLKPLKQKLITDGVVYLLQEVFGIENRETDRDRVFECSICKDNESDTLLLPCRHLCICNNCDDSFLHNVKECPICRTPVKALLTLDAVRLGDADSRSSRIGHLNIEHVKLTEALNGPIVRSGTNTLSRNSVSSNSTRSSRRRGSYPKREFLSSVFPREPSESGEHSGDAIELQDIHIERELSPLPEVVSS
ncbi:RING-type E3 ubiquitin transferase [Aphelenchoides fujianensis]|nr:RING-type E3 ubiquitin transferase [Aphelenchoides fujianensis]